MIHMFSGYEEIESGVEPFEVRILRDQRVNLLHVRGIFELGNLNPELLISSQVYRRWKTYSSKLCRHVLWTQELVR